MKAGSRKNRKRGGYFACPQIRRCKKRVRQLGSAEFTKCPGHMEP